MNMKKLLLIPLLLLTVLSMAACGGGDDEPFNPDNRKLPNNREKKRMENQKLPMYLL